MVSYKVLSASGFISIPVMKLIPCLNAEKYKIVKYIFLGIPNDWSDSNTFQPATDWNLTDSGQSPMWSGPGGETHLVQ